MFSESLARSSYHGIWSTGGWIYLLEQPVSFPMTVFFLCICQSKEGKVGSSPPDGPWITFYDLYTRFRSECGWSSRATVGKAAFICRTHRL